MTNMEEAYLLQCTTYGNWQRDDAPERDPDDYYEQEDYE